MSTLKKNVFLATVIFIIFSFFYPTIFYSVKLFDEIIPFKESYLPTCFSLSEMLELISILGLHQHFEATNTLYSNIVSIRCNPFGNLLQMFIQLIFQKKPVFYHLYSLILHLINSGIVFLLIYKIGSLFAPKISERKRFLVTSLLTLLWSLHPTNIESVLLLSNANIILSYTLCFLAVFIFLIPILNGFNVSIKNSLVIFFLFLCAQFIAEFHFMLPLILLAYLVVFNTKSTHKPTYHSFKILLINTMPFMLAMILFVLFFAFSNTGTNIKKQQEITLILERIFWLSPQVLFHFIKLFFLPIKLSVDQSLLVILGKSLLSPYSIFCFSFIFINLILSLISFSKTSKSFPFFFIIFFLPLLSLIPFSQILAPLYNLASERYLYFPSFIFIFGISHYIFHLLSKSNNKELFIITFFLSLLTTTYSIRAYIRTLDWKDSFTLYYSAIKANNNPLNKAFRYKGLTPQNKIQIHYPEEAVDKKYLHLAMKNLRLAIKNLKIEKEKYQSNSPLIVKSYGLDPGSLLEKAGYYLAQTDFQLNKNYKRAFRLISPYTKDLTRLDGAGLSFYGAILYYNELEDQSEKILRKALELFPYSTRIIFPLCDLIQIKSGNLNEIEKLSLRAFNYFPYDSFTLFAMSKMYQFKGNIERYAFFSYIYGLRHHEANALLDSEKAYLYLNKRDMAEKARKRREFIEEYLRKKLLRNKH